MSFLKLIITTFLIVGFLESANAQLPSPEGEPFTYVIQSTYSYDNGSVLKTCNCYRLSRSGYVHGSIAVSRSNMIKLSDGLAEGLIMNSHSVL